MSQIESLIFLVAAAALLAPLAGWLRVPYPVFLVVGGAAIGFVPGLPTVEIAAEVIFVAFLPPLLNASANSFSPLGLRQHLRPISFLAIGLVLVTATAVAVFSHYVVGLPWAVGFVLGGILAPTDPVAAEAVFRRLGVPTRVETIVGGESLVNDGSGLALYQVALAAVVTGVFTVWGAAASFVLVGGGGLLLGVAIAWLISPLWKKLSDPTVTITLSVLIPYGVYILADSGFGVSGILAVVAYGLYQAWKSPIMYSNASTRLQAMSFWGTLIFVLEALLFILLGQQLPSILSGLDRYNVVQVALLALLVYGVLLATRFGWLFAVPYIQPLLDRFFKTRYLRAPWKERVVMGWSGMRGAVSLAAALAIPLTVQGGAEFPERNLVLALAFGAILLTLVVQGLTLGPLVAAMRFEDEDETEGRLAELKARHRSTLAALRELERRGEESGVPEPSRVRMRREYEERLKRYESGLRAGGLTRDYSEESRAWRSLRQSLLDAERAEIVAARDRGEVSPEVMRRIQRDLDLEESRIGG
ncbi:Na+/H+ antiporter [Rubrobacter radiotolerans]|uniref:Na+/H+ antiporter n=1 Tax=Rubrobacter radiotolerans TaxID=42256 RepID=A0AB35T3R0_RUBRA|nr:Na+/H+ antiporter [Rubrobacter radiotolerans]MDX5894359.1 Na+/H+ antiporter [Rubrobacter radiotolerans]